MMRPEAHDERAHRRLATGYVISLIIHALAALLFFAVSSLSSDQSAQEANQESATITVSRSAAAPKRPQRRTIVAPPHAPVARFVAQPRAAAHQRLRTFHELARIVPHGPSNAKPVPLASELPNPVATEAVLVPRPQQSIAAVPLSLPGAVPAVSLKGPPTAAPTAAPTKTPATPVPNTPAPPPVAKISPSPVTPAPAVTAARVAAVPTAVPAKSPGPSVSTAAPAPVKGSVPRAAPTGAALNKGTSSGPRAGPQHSPGPGVVATLAPKPAAAPKPIQVPPTATPPPAHKVKPQPSKAPSKQQAHSDLNARLKGLIPNAPVHYSQKRVSPGAAGVHPSEPTPPPEVLARTKYIYRGSTRSMERSVTAYVTSLKGSTCTGWLIRYPPRAPDRYGQAPGPFRPGAINYPGSQGENGFRPIIEPDATFRCNANLLSPYIAASPGPSLNP